MSFKKVLLYIGLASSQLLLMVGTLTFAHMQVMPKVHSLEQRITKTIRKFQSVPTTESIYKDSESRVVRVENSEGTGTGFIIDGSGLIATNFHVIEKCPNNKITFGPFSKVFKSETFEVEVIAVNRIADLAILRIADPKVTEWLKTNRFDKYELADGEEIRSGTQVMTIGHPLGNIYMASFGVISNLSFTGSESERHIVFYSDVQIFLGNSGGPLINVSTGRVLGVFGFRRSDFDSRVSGGPIGAYLKEMLIRILEEPKDGTNRRAPKLEIPEQNRSQSRPECSPEIIPELR